MGGKPKRSRAKRIYFVGPAKFQHYSQVEADDVGLYRPLVRPLVWKAAKKVLNETMLNAKEPYAIYKLSPVMIVTPPVKIKRIGRSFSDKIKPGKIPPATLYASVPVKNGLIGKFGGYVSRFVNEGGRNEIFKKAPDRHIDYVAYGTGETPKKPRTAKKKKAP